MTVGAQAPEAPSAEGEAETETKSVWNVLALAAGCAAVATTVGLVIKGIFGGR